MKYFTGGIEASFLTRPNRFLITAETAAGVVHAHCPNPGRLEELLHPGRKIILEKAPEKTGKAVKDRKTPYTLAAAEYKGKIIPLHSVKANDAARELIIPRLFPRSSAVIPEHTLGPSRFDFLVLSENTRHLVEVKACTLVENGTAMFPDAPSTRAKRHIGELYGLSSGNTSGHIIFVIMHADALRFIPNLHTDPEFAAELRRVAERVRIHAVSARCGAEGELEIVCFDIPVDFSPLELARQNRGSYLILARLSENVSAEAGALGKIYFKKGWYVYTGSAMKNLTQRMARHLRKNKKYHWHIDYLLKYADKVKGYPVYSYSNLECYMAENIAPLAFNTVPGFGSSDCSCSSHLFYFPENPMLREDFTDILFSCRHTHALQK